MDIVPLLKEAFSAPAPQPKWEAELLTALGYDKIRFSQDQGIMRALKPIMAELHVRANDVTTKLKRAPTGTGSLYIKADE